MDKKKEYKNHRKISFLLIGLILGSVLTFTVSLFIFQQALGNPALNDWKVRQGDWARLQLFYADTNWENPLDIAGNSIFLYITDINITSVWDYNNMIWLNGSALWGHTIDRQANGTIMNETIDWMGIYNVTSPFPFSMNYWAGEQGFFVSPIDVLAFFNFFALFGNLGLGMNSSLFTANTTHFTIELWNGTASKQGIYDTDRYWRLTYNNTKNVLETFYRYHWNSTTVIWDNTFIGQLTEYSWRDYYIL